MTAWHKSGVRNVLYEIHYWVGMLIGLYIFLISISGGVVVFHNELSRRFSVEWLVNFHQNLLLGPAGRLMNGVGAICLTSLCLTGAAIWWPGIKNWPRSLTISWKARFPRITWDLHSALGFWLFPFVMLWGISGIYFAFPDLFYALPDPILSWLSQLHIGRFGWFAQVLWSLMGLVPAVLSFTGIFICCRRMIYQKSSNPNT